MSEDAPHPAPQPASQPASRPAPGSKPPPAPSAQPPTEADRRRPIGVFDSGVGGLTVVAALRRQLPHESIVYLGDTARLPYGSKSEATVTEYTRKNVDFLRRQGVKAVVVACNTASALALPNLPQEIPTWGVIGPGARAAAAATRGRVGVIATESTVRSDAYGRALRELRPEVSIESRACPLFVPLVEEGWHDDPVTEEVARRYLAPLLAGGIDTLVLGCTHYPMLRPVLQRVAGEGVTLVDSAESTAREVAEGLAAAGLRAPAPGGDDASGTAGADVRADLSSGALSDPRSGPPFASPFHRLFVTDASENFGVFARRILGSGDTAALEWVEVV